MDNFSSRFGSYLHVGEELLFSLGCPFPYPLPHQFPCPTYSLDQVTKNPSEETLASLGARNWPTWSCGVSKFPWTYEGTETCYILEGDVTVTPNDGRQPVTVGKGDLCVFPDRMSCVWDVKAPINKHYKFE
ncbi:unnamed protein product [Choristocarpus tenellus]